MVLFLEAWTPDFIRYHLQSCARFFQMFSRLVHGRIVRLPLAAHDFQRALDLLLANPPEVVTQCLIASHLITHRFTPAPVARCCNAISRSLPPQTTLAVERAGIRVRP